MMTNNFQTNSKNKGGRPVKKIKRTKQLNLIFTESEFSAIVKKAEARGMKPTTFCYFLIEGKDLTVLERSQTLTKCANSFSKISNYMRMGIFNEVEKQRLIDEIQNVIQLIKREIQ